MEPASAKLSETLLEIPLEGAIVPIYRSHFSLKWFPVLSLASSSVGYYTPLKVFEDKLQYCLAVKYIEKSYSQIEEIDASSFWFVTGDKYPSFIFKFKDSAFAYQCVLYDKTLPWTAQKENGIALLKFFANKALPLSERAKSALATGEFPNYKFNKRDIIFIFLVIIAMLLIGFVGFLFLVSKLFH